MNLFRRLERVWQIEDISPVQRLVLANLVYRADEHSATCYPSAGRIAADTGLSRRGVQKVVETLARQGLIAVESSGSGKGRNAPNKYRLTFLEIANGVRHSQTPEWRTAKQGMANGATANGEPGSHEPLNHKETIAARPSAGALALEARAPRRSRSPEPGESPEAKRRRQLLDVAELMRLQPKANEPEHQFLKRVVERKAEWDRARGVQ